MSKVLHRSRGHSTFSFRPKLIKKRDQFSRSNWICFYFYYDGQVSAISCKKEGTPELQMKTSRALSDRPLSGRMMLTEFQNCLPPIKCRSDLTNEAQTACQLLACHVICFSFFFTFGITGLAIFWCLIFDVLINILTKWRGAVCVCYRIGNAKFASWFLRPIIQGKWLAYCFNSWNAKWSK